MKVSCASRIGEGYSFRFISGFKTPISSLLRGFLRWLFIFEVGLSVLPARATWVEKAPNISGSLNGVAFGNNTFVAVGDSGDVTVSQDYGESWDGNRYYGDDLNAVAFGNGTFVAVGDGGRIFRSTDNGGNWTDESPVSKNLHGIAFASGWFVAVGDNGYVYRSSNSGTSWSKIVIASAPDLNGIAYGNGWFVAVGNNGHIYRSNNNGATWERISYSGANLHAVAFGNGTFVAAGSYAYRSTDNGATWDLLGLDHIKNGVAFGEDRFVICGDYGIIFESDVNSSTVWNSIDSGASSFYGAAFGNHVFVAVGLLRTLYIEGTAASGITPQSANVESGGGSGTVTVSAPSGFAWTASSADSWIHIVSGASGSGSSTVSYTVDANPAASSLDGSVQVAGFTHTVHQYANTEPTTISPDKADFQQIGGSGSINVTAPVGRIWSAVPSAYWITISSGSPGSGNGTVNYSVSTNNSGAARSGSIVIDGKTFAITQETGTLSVSPVNARFHYSGGNGSFDVDVDSGHAWTPISGEAWIAITSYGGTGSGPVNYSVSQNDTGYFRTGEITVDGVVHTVEQEGRFPYIFTPSSTAYDWRGGTQRITLSTNPSDRLWTAYSDAAWLQITSATNGTGGGYLDVRILANDTVSNRFARVWLGDGEYTTTYLATQNGRPAAYSITPSSAAFPGSGGAKSVTVSATGGAEWTATSPVGWIAFTSDSGTGNGVANYTVDPNSTTNARSAVLTIAGKSHSVSQASGDTPDYCWVDPSNIREALPAGTTVGTLQIESVLPVASPVFALPPGYADNASFSITNNLLLSAEPFDAEAKDCYLPGIQAGNGHGGSWEGQILVSVDDDTLEDADADGLPEEDEIFQGSEDTIVDTDGDGQSDGEEVRIAGTDPLDPTSCLRISQFSKVGSAFDLQWTNMPGKIYKVLASDNLLDGFPYVVGETTNGFFSCSSIGYPHRCFKLSTSLPVVQQAGKLIADDAAAEDRFGDKVAIDGDTLVVGAKYDNNVGAAYLYERDAVSNQWNFVTKLTASDGASNDQFGYAVAIDSNTVVVGAKNDDSNRGAAYVFERDAGGEWNDIKKLVASDRASSDYFGYSVDISGDRIVVGSIWESGKCGALYLYERDAGGADNWGETKKLVASDAQAGDYLGCSVAISGDTIAAGAYGDDDYGTDAGAAYIFEYSQGGAGNWGEVKKLFGVGEMEGDYFGNTVTLDGDTLAVGAPQDDERARNAGAAYIFERNRSGAENWGQTRKIRVAVGATWNLFANGIDLDGDNLAAGAWNAQNADAVKSGTAFLFQRNLNGTDRWGLLQRFSANDGTDGAGFGWKIAVSDKTIAVGAPTDDNVATNAGAAYLFEIIP